MVHEKATMLFGDGVLYVNSWQTWNNLLLSSSPHLISVQRIFLSDKTTGISKIIC